jgi:HNH endonuclease
MTDQLQLLISIAAEGGSLALYGCDRNSERARYKVMIVDQTPTFLDEDNSGSVIRRDSGWLPTWPAAMQALDRYPWPNLTCLYVDPSVANDVWAAVQEYQHRSGQQIRASALNRWSKVCSPSQPGVNGRRPVELRPFLREPIPTIALAARYLDEAVSAHLGGNIDGAQHLISLANMREIRDWTESIWGKHSRHVQYRPILSAPPSLPKQQRDTARMPVVELKYQLRLRDGYHCRFCGIPLVRQEVRERIRQAYPEAKLWGRSNAEQHSALQAMWMQYDHIIPHSRGGESTLDNMVLTCAPCNFGRMEHTLEEVGLIDPRSRQVVRSSWDGLERFEAH